MRTLIIAFLVAAAACASGQTKLFNGKDLTGWKVYGTEKWYVQDGLLVSESGPDKEYGYLATEKPYRDFELTAEFKQEADGNSGIFFRSSIEGTKITGWQAEVAPPGHNTGGIYESYGDRKSTRLNSSHVKMSYAVFCLKKKIKKKFLSLAIR